MEAVKVVKVKEEVTSELSVTALTDIKFTTEFSIFEQQVKEDDTNNEYSGLPIKSEIPEELHINNEDDRSTVDEAFKGFPQGPCVECTVCDYGKKFLGLPIKAEMPDIKYGIGDDDIYIKLEPLITEELHIKNEDDGSTVDEAFKGFPQSPCVECTVCDYGKKCFGLPVNAEIPDIKYGIGDDDIYITLEPLTSEELHIKNEADGSTVDEAFKGFPQGPCVECTVCDYGKKCLGLPIKAEIPDIKYGIGDDDIYIKLEPLISEELHVKNEVDGSATDQEYRSFPQSKHSMKEVKVNEEVTGELSLTATGQKSSLERRSFTHTKEKPFTCGICDYTCGKKSTFKQHLLTHTGEKPFTCDRCDYKCALKGNLKQHLLTHSGEKPFTCDRCNYKSGRKGDLQKHILTHTGEKPFTCGRCDYKCGHKSNLQKHILTHSEEKPFTCGKCDYKCGQKGSLKLHLLTHSGEKPFTCGRCDYKCRLKTNLKQHLLTHSGEKPFTCGTCDYKFTRKSHLKTHILIHQKKISKNNIQ